MNIELIKDYLQPANKIAIYCSKGSVEDFFAVIKEAAPGARGCADNPSTYRNSTDAFSLDQGRINPHILHGSITWHIENGYTLYQFPFDFEEAFEICATDAYETLF